MPGVKTQTTTVLLALPEIVRVFYHTTQYEQNLRVVDIARTLGYKNPNHFSAAFKKRYGTAPSELK
jgi:AraC-like DNA-binding protein